MFLESVKTCQNVSKSSRVSKRVKTCQKVSKKCQKSVKNVSKRVKTCQNVSKNCRGAVFRVKTCQKNSFLTLFDTFFDTQFCLLGKQGCAGSRLDHGLKFYIIQGGCASSRLIHGFPRPDDGGTSTRGWQVLC